jgi:hypothetical protein
MNVRHVGYCLLVGLTASTVDVTPQICCPCSQTTLGCQCYGKDQASGACCCVQVYGTCVCNEQRDYKKETTSGVKIEVSYGDLVDKITILELKSTRMTNPQKRANVQYELGILNAILENILREKPDLAGQIWALKEELFVINSIMWDSENVIRHQESTKTFDDIFIQAARTIYINNDRRAAVKATINTILRSCIVEEKEYALY